MFICSEGYKRDMSHCYLCLPILYRPFFLHFSHPHIVPFPFILGAFLRFTFTHLEACNFMCLSNTFENQMNPKAKPLQMRLAEPNESQL